MLPTIKKCSNLIFCFSNKKFAIIFFLTKKMPYVETVAVSQTGTAQQYQYNDQYNISVLVNITCIEDQNLSNPKQIICENKNSVWIPCSDNGKVISYQVDGSTNDLVLQVPSLYVKGALVNGGVQTGIGSPSGLACNSKNYPYMVNNKIAKLITCTLDGQILAWDGNTTEFTQIIALYQNEQYYSLILDSINGNLYVADFYNNSIIVFNSNWKKQTKYNFALPADTDEIQYSKYKPIMILERATGYNSPCLIISYTTSDFNSGIIVQFTYEGNYQATLVKPDRNLKYPYGLSKLPSDFNAGDGSYHICVSDYNDGVTRILKIKPNKDGIYEFTTSITYSPYYKKTVYMKIPFIAGIFAFDNKLLFVADRPVTYDSSNNPSYGSSYGWLKYKKPKK